MEEKGVDSAEGIQLLPKGTLECAQSLVGGRISTLTYPPH